MTIMKFLDGLLKRRKWKSTNAIVRTFSIDSLSNINVTVTNENGQPIKKRVKPKDVVNELYTEQKTLDFANLDEKIKSIKRRIKLCNESQVDCTRDMLALEWLRARAKGTINKFKWQITTQEKIQKLLTEYELAFDDISRFIKDIPEEGLLEMKEYTKLFRETTGQDPKFSIIAPRSDFEKDPIIVSDSPFGNYYYVLGAWDKEIEIVDKLWKE